MFGLGPGKKLLVIDLGSSALRIAEIGKTKAGLEVRRYIHKEFSSDPSLEEEIRRKVRLKALEDALKESRIRTRQVICAVPGQSVFTRYRTLPPVPEYKVSQIVRYEIHQQIPFSLDQLAMDYQIVSKPETGGYDVLMAAIKNEVVEKHIAPIEAVNRKIAVVDVVPFALYNWFRFVGEFGNPAETIALIHIGASVTDIVIERAGVFRFTRSLNIGGDDLTAALAEAFGVPFSDAEKVKRDRAFAPTGDPARDGKGGEVVGKVLQRLCTEILRSFSYFRSQPGGGPVTKVLLTGGGACLRNIVPYFQRQLNLDVRIAQPLRGITIAPGAALVNEKPEQCAVALGLALRCVEEVPLTLNLIPPRVVHAARRKEQVVYWALSFAALGLIMASIVPVKANENKAVQKRIETLKTYIQKYDPELAQRIRPGAALPPSTYVKTLNKAKEDVNRLREDVRKLDRAILTRTFWLDEIALVSEARPTTGGMWFSSIETAVISAEGQEKKQGAPGAAPPAPGRAGLGAFAALGRGSLTGAGGKVPAGITVTGFPGLAPSGFAAGGGLTGLGGGGSRRQQQTKQQNEALRIPKANGLIVNGVAQSDKIIKEYVDTLRRAEQSLPDGGTLRVANVYFSEASVQKVDPSVLYNLPEDVSALQPQGATAGWQPDANMALYSFVVYVVFDRGAGGVPKGGAPEEPPAPPAAPVAQAAPASSDAAFAVAERGTRP